MSREDRPSTPTAVDARRGKEGRGTGRREALVVEVLVLVGWGGFVLAPSESHSCPPPVPGTKGGVAIIVRFTLSVVIVAVAGAGAVAVDVAFVVVTVVPVPVVVVVGGYSGGVPRCTTIPPPPPPPP